MAVVTPVALVTKASTSHQCVWRYGLTPRSQAVGRQGEGHEVALRRR